MFSDRPSLANYDSLHKYSKSVAMYIYQSRCHFKHLPIGYFLSHLFGCVILIVELFAMDFVLNYELSGRNFQIFDTFSQPPIHRNDSLSLLFPYQIKVYSMFLEGNFIL